MTASPKLAGDRRQNVSIAYFPYEGSTSLLGRAQHLVLWL